MASTYDPALSTDKDWVRFLVGDRDVSDPRLQDEELYALLREEANKYLAAAAAAELILGRNGGLVEKQVGDLRLKWGGSAQDQYQKYIDHLRRKGAGLTLEKQNVFRVL
jgi:hypothetical protein